MKILLQLIALAGSLALCGSFWGYTLYLLHSLIQPFFTYYLP